MQQVLRFQRDVALQLGAAADLHQALDTLLEAAVGLPGVDCGGVYFVAEDTGDVELAAHRGLSPEFIGLVRFCPAGSIQANLVHAGTPLYLSHSDLEQGPIGPPCLAEGLRHLAGIPIMHEGRAVAALNLSSRTQDALPEAMRTVIETTAAQVGAAIARHRAQNALRESEARLDALVDNLPFDFFAMDLELRYARQNALSRVHWGDVTGMRPWDLGFSDDLLEELVGHARRAMDGETVHAEFCIQRQGEDVVLSNVIAPILVRGAVTGILGISIDVTEQRRLQDALEERVAQRTAEIAAANRRLEQEVGERRAAEQALRQQEQRLQSIGDNLPSGAVYRLVHASTGERRFEHVSAGFEHLFGLPAAAVLEDASKLYALVHPADAEQALRREAGAAQRLEPYRHECRFVLPGGAVRWFRWHSMPERLPGGGLAWNGVVIDITERRRTEERLRMLSRAVEQSTEGLAVANLDGYLLFVNQAYAAMHGYTPEELDGRHLAIFHAPHQRPRVEATNRQILERGQFTGEIGHIHRDGTEFLTWMTNALLRDENGAPFGFLAAARDITEYRRTQDALRESEERYRGFVQNFQGIAYRARPDLAPIFLHGAVQEITGYAEAEFLEGRPRWCEIVHPDDREQAGAAIARALAQPGTAVSVEYRVVRKDGAVRWVHDTCQGVRTPDHGPCCLQGALYDATPRRKAEEEAQLRQQQLVQADKMASLGILVSGVAHEINNPNHFIMANLNPLRAVWRDLEPLLERYYEAHGGFELANMPYEEARAGVPRMFDAIAEGSKRIKAIVDELRDFAREQPPGHRENVQINAVVRSAVTLLSNMIAKSTNCFQAHYGRDLPEVHGQYQRLEQVVINLVQNACQALPNPDCAVTVATRYDAAQDHVVVEVADEGVGIPGENLNHITDPFFTTKRERRGTGLGLSISSGIIMEHNGRLRFESNPGQGTRALVHLPALQDTSED